MNRPDFESRLRGELRELYSAPIPALRDRILNALDDAPDRTRAVTALDTAPVPGVSRYTTWVAGLAACLLALIALRTVDVNDAPEPPPVAPTAALTETLDDSAVEMESNLLAQADLLAEDARRAAAILLDRMPAAPWARRTDGR
jgi:hypothetical protein